jgi:AGCS family alanine or glycine:cation symporter
MALVILVINITAIGPAFGLIFGNVFTVHSALAGVGGYMIAKITQQGITLIVQKGLARGIFSNEAGLGSSVIAHSASQTREPVKQGFWGIFEVFFDTFIICTLTALVVLVTFGSESGLRDVLYAGKELADGTTVALYQDTMVSMMAFEKNFGVVGKVIYTIILPLFAFTTIVAWSYYGEKSVEYLFRKTGEKGKKIARTVFKVLYVLLVIVASVVSGDLVWAISDTCNGLMALPNLIGIILLSTLVAKLTKNYLDRKKGAAIEPMLSAYPEQNAQFMADIEAESATEATADEQA